MALMSGKWFKSEKISSKIGGLLPPSFLKRSRGAAVPDTHQNTTLSDLTTLKNLQSQKEVIRALIQNSPDASLAVSSLARTAITPSYTVVAYSLDGKIDVNATVAAVTMANRLDKLKPAYDGFYFSNDFRSLSEKAVLQLCITGGFGAELVLGKGQIPRNVNIFSIRTLKYRDTGTGGVIPYITLNGEEYELDSPLVHISELDQDVESAYTVSPLSAAVQPVLADLEFVNDLRRAFSKASLPRPAAKIDYEMVMKLMPLEISNDKEAREAYLSSIIEQIENQLNGLNPEDALVHFDTVEVSHLSAGNISAHNSVKEHKELINAKVSSGLRTLPSILGRGESSSAASTESMLYLLAASGVQGKLNTMYGGLLTTAVRMLGHDCYVNFTYEPPSLRPEIELESFRSMKQSRIREQCSDGLISDEEFAILTTGSLPSGNFTPLSGTGFHKGAAQVENPYSNTSVTGKGVTETQSQKNNNPGTGGKKSDKTTGR